MKEIRKYFEKYTAISDEDWNTFSSRLSRNIYPKKTLLLKAGKIEKHLSFIEQGIIRFYIDNGDGELTFSFAFNNSFFSAYDSFLTQSPSTYNVESLTDCTVWQLAFDDLQIVT